MILKNAIKVLSKSSIKAGDGKEKGEFPLYTCSSVVNKYLDDYMCEKETVIVSTGGNFSIHYVNQKFNYSTDCLAFTNNENFKLKYIYYYLLNKKRIIDNMFRGSGLKHLNRNEFFSIDIECLDFNTQNKIIEELDIINDAILNRKDQLQDIEKLIQFQFVNMFGQLDSNIFPIKKLSEIANVGSSHRVFTSEFVKEGIPFYRGTEISQLSNGIVPKDCYYISKEHYNKLCNDNTKPKVGDLLLPSICDKGQIWLVDTEEPFYYKDGRVLCISLTDSNINNKYFYYYMKLKTMSEYIKLGKGTTFAEFKIFILKNFDISIPPIELQNKFENFINLLLEQKNKILADIKDLEKLLEIRMNNYFN